MCVCVCVGESVGVRERVKVCVWVAVWPNLAIWKVLGDKISSKSSQNNWLVLGPCLEWHFLIQKTLYGNFFLTTFVEKWCCILFHLVTLGVCERMLCSKCVWERERALAIL